MNISKDEVAKVLVKLHATHGLSKSETVRQENIWLACDALKEAGIDPTMRGVREVLGKGSPGTINDGKRAWEKEQEALREAASTAPDKSQKTLDLFEALWVEATRSGRQEAAALKAQLDRLIEKHEKEIAEANAALDETDKQLEATRVEMSVAIQRADDERARHEIELLGLRADLRAADARASEEASKAAAAEGRHASLSESYDKLLAHMQGSAEAPTARP